MFSVQFGIAFFDGSFVTYFFDKPQKINVYRHKK